MKKRHIILKSFKALIRVVWNLLLLCIYAAAKLTEIVSGFLRKLTEKLLNKHN